MPCRARAFLAHGMRLHLLLIWLGCHLVLCKGTWRCTEHRELPAARAHDALAGLDQDQIQEACAWRLAHQRMPRVVKPISRIGRATAEPSCRRVSR